MAGLPILHPGLSVAVIGARQWRRDWLGMLLTPWCMNLVIVPGRGPTFVPGTVGSKQVSQFPAGDIRVHRLGRGGHRRLRGLFDVLADA
jgi:[NiFe] hydrogenase assembly HybE family chaperone